MNKIQKQANRVALHRLLDVVLDVNGFEKRSKERTGEKPTVFVDIAGNMAMCRVQVYKTGWEKDEESDLGSVFCFDEPIVIDGLIERLQALK